MTLLKKVLLVVLLTPTVSYTQANSALLTTYANIAEANYRAALTDAQALQRSIQTVSVNPTEQTLQQAKTAWLLARESYGQTEAFRLSNGPIDAERGWVAEQYGALEGQINAWPLDEALIDYTIDANGNQTRGNIIDSNGNHAMFTPPGDGTSAVNVSTISVEAITQLNENGAEANIAAGYHAIEFLLWGQDQDYQSFIKDEMTNGALTAGQRPLSDFTTERYSERRKAYLTALADKLVQDLTVVYSAWALDDNDNYRAALLGNHIKQDHNIKPQTALRQIFSGLGVFIKSELANERIAVAVLTPSEEDEHSCFSDNTHRDIAMNYQGFKNVLMGTYNGVDYGEALIDGYADKRSLYQLMDKIEADINRMDVIARTSRHFDYQIRPNDPQVKNIVRLKNNLRKLGDAMVKVAAANGVNLLVGDVTDTQETTLN